MQALLRKRELFGAQGNASQICLELRYRHLSQRAPAAADFQYPLPGLQIDHLQRPAHLGRLGGGHRAGLVAVEPGCGVVHGLIEPEPVEVVAQVVVGVDVLAAVGTCVAVHPVPHAQQCAADPVAVNDRLDFRPVRDEQLEQVCKVWCAPVARDVTLGKTYVARAQRGLADVPVA